MLALFFYQQFFWGRQAGGTGAHRPGSKLLVSKAVLQVFISVAQEAAENSANK